MLSYKFQDEIIDIRNIKFSKSVGGYKQEEVDILLDKVENDYEQYERNMRELGDKIDSLNAQIEGYKETQASIQNVLLSAQKLADQIVEEAKQKSEEIINNAEANISIITAREKELSNAFELKASERKAVAESEINAMLEEAKRKSDAIDKATEVSVNRQQMLFDRLKLEISAFKAEITKSYKEHLEILQKLPDVAAMDPTRVAELLSMDFTTVPSVETTKIVDDSVRNDNDDTQESFDDTSSDSTGFIVSDDI